MSSQVTKFDLIIFSVVILLGVLFGKVFIYGYFCGVGLVLVGKRVLEVITIIIGFLGLKYREYLDKKSEKFWAARDDAFEDSYLL